MNQEGARGGGGKWGRAEGAVVVVDGMDTY